MMIVVLESMVDESGERPRDGGEDEASNSAGKDGSEIKLKEGSNMCEALKELFEHCLFLDCSLVGDH